MRALEYPRISSNASGNHSLPPNKEEQDWDWQLFATACKRLAARLAWFPRLTAEAAPVLNCASLPTPPPVVDPCWAIHNIRADPDKQAQQPVCGSALEVFSGTFPLTARVSTDLARSHDSTSQLEEAQRRVSTSTSERFRGCESSNNRKVLIKGARYDSAQDPRHNFFYIPDPYFCDRQPAGIRSVHWACSERNEGRRDQPRHVTLSTDCN